MMAERKKPRFLRKDWHKKIKLGSAAKKVRKWRAAKGRHNKIRLNRKGHSRRPKIGWGVQNKKNILVIRNLKQFEDLEDKEILLGMIGKKKRDELIKKANEMKITILNKYKAKVEEVTPSVPLEGKK